MGSLKFHGLTQSWFFIKSCHYLDPFLVHSPSNSPMWLWAIFWSCFRVWLNILNFWRIWSLRLRNSTMSRLLMKWKKRPFGLIFSFPSSNKLSSLFFSPLTISFGQWSCKKPFANFTTDISSQEKFHSKKFFTTSLETTAFSKWLIHQQLLRKWIF